MRLHCVAAVALGVLACVPATAAGEEPAALASARALYNASDYAAAIAAAAVAGRDAAWADAAALVAARAHLEQYRQLGDTEDLSMARDVLVTVRAAALGPRDQVDLLIGLGQALYLGDTFGAAAELFDTALARAYLLNGHDRLTLLDWWATALDRDAQARPEAGRVRVFERIAARMEDELLLDAGSRVANYWRAVSARGIGDLDAAWNAAVAAWVRSTLSREGGERLRVDLDRLVTDVLIPERARAAGTDALPDVEAQLRAEWATVKQQWQ